MVKQRTSSEVLLTVLDRHVAELADQSLRSPVEHLGGFPMGQARKGKKPQRLDNHIILGDVLGGHMAQENCQYVAGVQPLVVHMYDVQALMMVALPVMVTV